MAKEGEYRVTRGGKDLYVGPIGGLVAAAREGVILANDLIYDPKVKKWVFARSLGALTGFPLKGHRMTSVDATSKQSNKLLNEVTLKKRQRNRRRVVAIGVFCLFVTSTAILVWLVPTTSIDVIPDQSVCRARRTEYPHRRHGSGRKGRQKPRDKCVKYGW